MQNDDLDHKRLLRKVSLRLLPFMFVLYIISYLDRINISFAGKPMCAELGFSEQVFGFGAGIFFFGYCLFGIPSNIVLQKVGARKWIAFIMVVWGFVSVGMAFVPNATVFCWMRFLLGIAEAGFFPGMIFYLTKWFPRREHAMAVAKFMSAIPAAGILGSIISSRVLEMPVTMNLPAWKWLFIITGSPAVLLGLSVLLLLPDGPRDTKWLKPEEQELIVTKLEDDDARAAAISASVVKSDSVSNSVLQTVSNWPVWVLALLYFTLTLGMYGFQLWLPQIIDATSHSGAANTAFLTILPAIFQAVGMIVIAGNSDKTGERKWHLAAAAFTAALGLILASQLHDPAVMLGCLCITAFGIWGTVGPFWALPSAFLRGSSSAVAIGLINSVGNLGGFAGPYIVGFIKHHNPDFGASLLSMAISLALGGVLALSLKLRKPLDGESTSAH